MRRPGLMRRASAAAAAAGVLAVPAAMAAQPSPPGVAPPAAETVSRERAASNQELSGALGVELGGQVSPGGLHLAGSYLYQLSEQDWFDGGLSFTFGGDEAACFRDRESDFVCDHGVTDGFAGEVAGGVRRYFPGQAGFTPYARAALGLRLVSYSADDVTGFALPLQLGGGVRAKVAERISVAGGADLRIGPAWLNHDLGIELNLGLTIQGAVEFRL